MRLRRRLFTLPTAQHIGVRGVLVDILGFGATISMMSFGSLAVALANKAFDKGSVSFLVGLGPNGTPRSSRC